MDNKKHEERQSNIELLRILCMLGIIASHYVTQGGAINNCTGFNLYLSFFVRIFGKLGVNVFVVITAWFTTDHRVSGESQFKIWFKTLIYQVLFVMLALIAEIGDFSLGIFVKSFLPVTGNLNWYVTAYFGFVLLIPFVNLALQKLDRKKHSILLVLLSIYTIIWPLVFNNSSAINDVIWFIYIYILVGFIKHCYGDQICASTEGRKFKFIGAGCPKSQIDELKNGKSGGIIPQSSSLLPDSHQISKKNDVKVVKQKTTNGILGQPGGGYSTLCILIFVVSLAVMFASEVIIYWTGGLENSDSYILMNSPFQLLAALSLFIVFINLNMGCCRLINMISSHTYGIFILHTVRTIRYGFLWEEILRCSEFYASELFTLHLFTTILAIFTVCAILDSLMNYIFFNKIFATNTFQPIYKLFNSYFEIGENEFN